MEYVREDQILLYEELCAKPVDYEIQVNKATRLFRENVRLANSIAKKISYPYDASIDKDDILQSAYEGLWRSCLNYDDSQGAAFSTYAVPMIKGTILRLLRDTEAIHTPRSFKDIRSALHKHNFTLPLTDQEIDTLIEEKVASRGQLIRYMDVQVMSMDMPMESGDTDYLYEILPDPNSYVGPTLDDETIEEIIDKILTYIKPAGRDLVEEWMYSTLEGNSLTQQALATKYNVSQPQVGRYLRSAIRVVRMHGDEIKDLFGI